METINLVNKRGDRLGPIEKMEAHQRGLLHEAFSIIVFNSKGQLLLQKRALQKYHSGGLWSNACCSHPRAEEELEVAIHRRLKEEMGFDCILHLMESPASRFYYKFELANGLIEHELNYVFLGESDALPIPNAAEVSEYKWISMFDLLTDIRDFPARYTPWFRLIAQKAFII